MSDKSHEQWVEDEGRWEHVDFEEVDFEEVDFEEVDWKKRERLAIRKLEYYFAHRKALDANVEPPNGALVDWFVPPDRAEDMLLVLQKAFEERWVPKYGTRCARRMFFWHAVWSVIGFRLNWMMKHLSLLKVLASGRG